MFNIAGIFLVFNKIESDFLEKKNNFNLDLKHRTFIIRIQSEKDV